MKKHIRAAKAKTAKLALKVIKTNIKAGMRCTPKFYTVRVAGPLW